MQIGRFYSTLLTYYDSQNFLSANPLKLQFQLPSWWLHIDSKIQQCYQHYCNTAWVNVSFEFRSSFRSCKLKQNKVEYQQLLTDLSCLGFSSLYETLEVSVLGHHQCFSVKNALSPLHFIHPNLPLPKAMVQQMVDTAARKYVSVL